MFILCVSWRARLHPSKESLVASMAPRARIGEPLAPSRTRPRDTEAMNPVQLDRYIDAVLRHRWLVVALATLLMLITAGGGRFIKTTNDYRIMFGENNPQLAAFNALENTFSTSDTALIAITPREGSVFTKEALGAIEDLTKAAWKTPHSSRGRLPHQLFPQPGGGRRSDCRAARRRRERAYRRRPRANQENRAGRHRNRRAPRLPRRTRGSSGRHFHPA